ncbi:hypothetical protein MKX01_012844 [Papaver californicum]|nr:hypothetical protein MKX01_012844 [Papaver californicum]
MDVFDQDVLIMFENTSGMGKEQRDAMEKLEILSRDGFMRMMMENKLDAMVSPGWSAASVLAIGGYPGISVPAGYETNGMPVGICFGGLRGSEATLIEILTLLNK